VLLEPVRAPGGQVQRILGLAQRGHQPAPIVGGAWPEGDDAMQ
jgi:hypothetical protein